MKNLPKNLKPAILYKNEIDSNFASKFYTMDMMMFTGCMDNWSPEIVECPSMENYQLAIVDNDEQLVGYIGFKVDYYASCAYNFGLFSFDRGNLLIGFALNNIIKALRDDWHIHRVEWHVVGDNSAKRIYDILAKKYNGHVCHLHDAIKDRCGVYHDTYIYELLFNDEGGNGDEDIYQSTNEGVDN